MTYDEIVLKVRDAFENADAREIFVHIAVQVNIVGEGSGAFYIEVAGRKVTVEPYDYYDRDGLWTTDAQTLVAISDGKLSLAQAIEQGVLKMEGNMEKMAMMQKIKLRKECFIKHLLGHKA